MMRSAVVALAVALAAVLAVVRLPSVLCEPPRPPFPVPLPSPLRYVDPFIGTGGVGYGAASLWPGASEPFGNVRLSPDTAPEGLWLRYQHFGGYHHDDSYIRGISHTHMVGSGVLDLGNIRISPSLQPFPSPIAFSHKDEIAVPGYYGVNVMNSAVSIELTASQLVGFHRYTFDASVGESAWITVSPSTTLDEKACKNASFSYDASKNVVSGFVRNAGEYSGFGFNLYFVADFSGVGLKVQSVGRYTNESFDEGVVSDVGCGLDMGFAIAFSLAEFPAGTAVVEFPVAISYISADQAFENLQAQTQGGSRRFDDILGATMAKWSSLLSIVDIGASTSVSPNNESSIRTEDIGSTRDEQTVFYTALYHSFMAPSRYNEANGVFMGFDNNVHHISEFGLSAYYSDMSIWDTHRSEAPLLSFLVPDVQTDIVRSLLCMAKLGGDLPRWPFVNGYTGGMFGNHADAVIADYLLRNSSFLSRTEIELLYVYMKNQSIEPRQHTGRTGLADYLSLGYVTLEDSDHSACLTLAYAYDDHSVGVVANLLGYEADYEYFMKASTRWQNVLDPKSLFFCPRQKNGDFACEADKIAIFSRYYVEGDAWHYRYWVPHDIEGLASFYPSASSYTSQLETLASNGMECPLNDLPCPYYWPGNEPDILSLYEFLDLSKTQHWLRMLAPFKFTQNPDGIPGNDDYGTMSAWYVWYALGFYPATAVGEYRVGIPRFSNIAIHRPQGVVQVICACCDDPSVPTAAIPLQDADIKFRYDRIENGGSLVFTCPSSS
eukprot:ANDGO_01410.mRNA.1 putative glycosidase Rv0584